MGCCASAPAAQAKGPAPKATAKPAPASVSPAATPTSAPSSKSDGSGGGEQPKADLSADTGGGGGKPPPAVSTAEVTLSLVEAEDGGASASGSTASQASRDAERARAESLSAMGEEWTTPTTAAEKEASAKLSVEADAKELRAAALNGDMRKVEAQLTAGVDVDGRAGDGQSALLIACSEGYTRIVTALLAAKADTSLTNSQTLFTPLHAAAHKGYMDCVAALLEAGADLGAKNRRGKTALQLATQKKRAAVVALLSATPGGGSGSGIANDFRSPRPGGMVQRSVPGSSTPKPNNSSGSDVSANGGAANGGAANGGAAGGGAMTKQAAADVRAQQLERVQRMAKASLKPQDSSKVTLKPASSPRPDLHSKQPSIGPPAAPDATKPLFSPSASPSGAAPPAPAPDWRSRLPAAQGVPLQHFRRGGGGAAAAAAPVQPPAATAAAAVVTAAQPKPQQPIGTGSPLMMSKPPTRQDFAFPKLDLRAAAASSSSGGGGGVGFGGGSKMPDFSAFAAGGLGGGGQLGGGGAARAASAAMPSFAHATTTINDRSPTGQDHSVFEEPPSPISPGPATPRHYGPDGITPRADDEAPEPWEADHELARDQHGNGADWIGELG
jgi:hypothetical protein